MQIINDDEVDNNTTRKIITRQTTPVEFALTTVRAPATKKQIPARLRQFFDSIVDLPGRTLEEQGQAFLAQAKREDSDNKNPYWAEDHIRSFLNSKKQQVLEEKLAAGTVSTYCWTIKIFCDAYKRDLPFIDWKMISKALPEANSYSSNDRVPTVEEIRKLIKYHDIRIRPLVLVMCSSGIRVGAWQYLKWKHVTPMKNDKGEIIAAKLEVYANTRQYYYTFMTLEAYETLKEYMDYRAGHREEITPESWLIRNKWHAIGVKIGKKGGRGGERGLGGLATCPKRLSYGAVKKILIRALMDQGLRNKILSEEDGAAAEEKEERTGRGERRYEFKQAHGFRKFFKTHAEGSSMNRSNVELLMGHKVGLQRSYYKPTEEDVLEDYLKAVPALTINYDESVLQKQVAELAEKNEEANYVIKGKLAEKEKEFDTMKEKIDLMELGFRHFIETGVLDPFLAGDSSRSGDLRSVLEERRKEIRSR